MGDFSSPPALRLQTQGVPPKTSRHPRISLNRLFKNGVIDPVQLNIGTEEGTDSRTGFAEQTSLLCGCQRFAVWFQRTAN